MTQNTTIKVRLHPTAAQAALLDKTFGCCRYIWNRILADHEEFYAATDRHFLPTPAKYKKEAPFLKEVDSQALVSVHQNLRGAFQRFFDRPDQFHHPVFKTKKSRRDAYTIYRSTQSNTLYLTHSGVRLPKLGIVPARFHRRPLHWWTLMSATVSKSPSGKYYCSLTFAYPVKEKEKKLPEKGKTLLITPDDTKLYLSPKLQQSTEKLQQLQSRLSRMVPGSRNYEQQLQKIRLLHEHIAAERKDFIHKQSRRIANEWDAVEMEVPADHLAPLGFGLLKSCLTYKLERQGKPCITLPVGTPENARQTA